MGRTIYLPTSNQPNVGKYISPMDGMGGIIRIQNCKGTESQRTPFSKLRSSFDIFRFSLGVRSVGPVGDFLESWFRGFDGYI